MRIGPPRESTPEQVFQILHTLSRKFTGLFRKHIAQPTSNSTQNPPATSDQAAVAVPSPSGPSLVNKPTPNNRRRRKKPVARTDQSGTLPVGHFGNLVISGATSKALNEMGYSTPTPIQEAVIPLVQNGQDVVGQAQTGTGKTAAFGIPITEALTPENNTVQALVLVPTRELAVQVRDELSRLGKYRRLRSVAVYGGQPISRQLEALQRGAHIVVATPGRLIDHIERGTIQLRQLKVAVLDEADQMLDIGFADDINRILRHVASNRQTLLFSATMPTAIKRLTYRYMKNPVWTLVGGESEPVDQVEQLYFEVAERDRYAAFQELFVNPDRITQALVFRRTKTGVDTLVNYLNRNGHNVQGIHGDLTQGQRNDVMSRFRAGRLRILVATNLAARGLDIPAVSHVINYDMPSNVEEYVHRIGRTARMGRPGTAITFVSEWDFDMLDAIQAHVGNELKLERLALYTG